MARKLVSIQKVWKIEAIPQADSIETAFVMGWQVVVKKGEFSPMQECLYFEVDCFLPIREEFEFLRATSYRNSQFMGEGFRIKTMRMRGQISQGLILPLSAFPEIQEGMDPEEIQKALGVRKWELPEVEGSAGTQIGNKPYGIPTTDEPRVQSEDSLRIALLGHPYYISTKMDGTSCTMYAYEGSFGVCGRNFEYKDDDKCSMWKFAHKHALPEKFLALNRNIALQGEFCGEGIQKNRLKLIAPQWYIFDAVDLDTHHYLGLDEMAGLAESLGLACVPIEERGDSFGYSLDEILERARGKYPSGQLKEGIVIRPPEYMAEAESRRRVSFKALNNDFLLKDKG